MDSIDTKRIVLSEALFFLANLQRTLWGLDALLWTNPVSVYHHSVIGRLMRRRTISMSSIQYAGEVVGVRTEEVERGGNDTNQSHAVACGQRENVGAGDRAGAHQLHCGFDGVDDAEAAQGVGVRTCVLLPSERGGVVQQHRRVAALRETRN